MYFFKRLALALFIFIFLFQVLIYTLNFSPKLSPSPEYPLTFPQASSSQVPEKKTLIITPLTPPPHSLYSTWQAVHRKSNGNNELQYYTSNNVVFDQESITLIAKQESLEEKQYTSGLIESTDAYLYGYFEFTVQLPQGTGLFPAIWLLPAQDKPLPEIDILENIGSDPYTFHGVTHYEENGQKKRMFFEHSVAPKDTYTVALKWEPTQLTWLIDNEIVYQTTTGIPQEYMYIIINLAVGGNWPGEPTKDTVFPNEFIIHSFYLNPSLTRRRP